MPGVMRDLVETLVAAQPDLEIVGGDADVVLVGVATIAEADALTARLYARPHQRLLALAVDGRTAVAYELRPHVTPLGTLSPEGLLAAIRAGQPAGSR
jgi:hypothetical protein